MGASPLAYALADHVNAMMASEQVQQETMAMEAAEYRDFLASQLALVLSGMIVPKPPPELAPTANPDAPIDQSRITDTIARQLLEQAPSEARAVYGKARRNGAAPNAALDEALKFMREKQEREWERQVA